jgi:hypothetical protein
MVEIVESWYSGNESEKEFKRRVHKNTVGKSRNIKRSVQRTQSLETQRIENSLEN